MHGIFFESETLPYDYENEWLHAYDLNEWLVVPNVGDIVNFENDSDYVRSEQCGTKFRIVAKEISFYRGKRFRDDCTITLTVDRVL